MDNNNSTETRDQQQQQQRHAPISDPASELKVRRNPFSFVTDLFRSKKADKTTTKTDPVNTKSRQTVTSDDAHSGSGRHTRRASHNSVTPASPRSLGSAAGSRLSTPKKQSQTELQRSVQMIHLSREDNPAVRKARAAGALSTADDDDVTSCDVTNTSPLDMHDVRDSSLSSAGWSPALSRDVLVRSPPPLITGSHTTSRDSLFSVSPRPGVYTRAQVENDVREILNLQLQSRYNSPAASASPAAMPISSPLMTSRSGRIQLAPLTKAAELPRLDPTAGLE